MELKRRDRVRVQTEMIEFIALPFPFSSKLTHLLISRRSCAGTAKKFSKSVKHVQTSSFGRFVDQTCRFFSDVLVPVAVVVA